MCFGYFAFAIKVVPASAGVIPPIRRINFDQGCSPRKRGGDPNLTEQGQTQKR